MINGILEIGISGGAYFAVTLPDASTAYCKTRVFIIDDTGRLASIEDYPVDTPIIFTPPYNREVRISEQGLVEVFDGASWTTVGTLTVYLFTQPQFLNYLGDGLYKATVDSGSATAGTAGGGGPFADVKITYPITHARRKRSIAALNAPDAIGDFIIRARFIVSQMTGNAYFPDPVPVLFLVSTHIDQLEAAETEAMTRTVGKAAARDGKYNIVLRDLQAWQMYVQGKADNAPTEVYSEAIVLSSGFDLKQFVPHDVPALSAKNGAVSGTVLLRAKAAEGPAAYEWQMSADEINWVPIRVTLQAHTTVTGLTPGTTIHFRVRISTFEGTGDWSGVVSIVIG